MDNSLATEVIEELFDRESWETPPDLDPDTKKTLYHFGYQLYNRGKYAKALPFFRLLTLVEIDKLRNWLALGSTLQAKGDAKEAERIYRAAAEIYRFEPALHLRIAETLFAQGKEQQAKEALDHAEEVMLNPKEEEHVIKAVAFLRKKWFGIEGE